MKPVLSKVVGRCRYHLVPQLKQSQCAGCAGWKGTTPDGGNLCTALGEACTEHPLHGYVVDIEYVPPAEPEAPVDVEELDEFEW